MIALACGHRGLRAPLPQMASALVIFISVPNWWQSPPDQANSENLGQEFFDCPHPAA
jgi:hypothetical protein